MSTFALLALLACTPGDTMAVPPSEPLYLWNASGSQSEPSTLGEQAQGWIGVSIPRARMNGLFRNITRWIDYAIRAGDETREAVEFTTPADGSTPIELHAGGTVWTGDGADLRPYSGDGYKSIQRAMSNDNVFRAQGSFVVLITVPGAEFAEFAADPTFALVLPPATPAPSYDVDIRMTAWEGGDLVGRWVGSFTLNPGASTFYLTLTPDGVPQPFRAKHLAIRYEVEVAPNNGHIGTWSVGLAHAAFILGI